MMEAGTLNAGPIAFAGGVVDGHDETLAGNDVFDGGEDEGGLVVGLASAGPDGRVALAELRGDAGSVKPGGNRAAASGEEHARENCRQTLGGTSLQARGNPFNNPGERIRWL
jgi:hypothetical protein